MIVVTEENLAECKDPIIWTNIAHALASEQEYGLPSSANSIFGWNDADFSQAGIGSRQREHIWIGGHGAPTFFEQTKALQPEEPVSRLMNEQTGLPKPPTYDKSGAMDRRGPVLSGITIQSCYGAKGDVLAGNVPEIYLSNLAKLTQILCEAGYDDIRSTAYVGQVISAPVRETDGSLMASRVIKTDPDSEKESGVLQMQCGWGEAKNASLALMASDGWQTMSFADRAHAIAERTAKFYKVWIDACEEAGILVPVKAHARSFTSHDVRGAAHLQKMAVPEVDMGMTARELERDDTRYKRLFSSPEAASSTSSK